MATVLSMMASWIKIIGGVEGRRFSIFFSIKEEKQYGFLLERCS